jgi:hypothetical protein
VLVAGRSSAVRVRWSIRVPPMMTGGTPVLLSRPNGVSPVPVERSTGTRPCCGHSSECDPAGSRLRRRVLRGGAHRLPSSRSGAARVQLRSKVPAMITSSGTQPTLSGPEDAAAVPVERSTGTGLRGAGVTTCGLGCGGVRGRRVRVPTGPWTRILQRLLALNTVIWHSWTIGAPVKRSPIAYDH